MNKEEIIQTLKDNPIKIIKCGDIEIPVEYLKQTTVNVNGDDYIKLQQENKILKENAENNDKVVDKVNWENQLLKKENKQLKEQLSVVQTNEETFRLEMEDITKTLGLDENVLFDDVKAYARNLKDNWNKLKEYIGTEWYCFDNESVEFEVAKSILNKMQELEQGSGSDE